MFLTPEQLAVANKASVDALLALANTALANAERIAALNLNAVRTMLEDGASTTRAVLGADDPRQAMALAATQCQPVVAQWLSYGRSLWEISAQSKEEVVRQFEHQFDDFEKQASSLMDEVARHAPPGAEVAVAALRSALEAARSAFGQMKGVLKNAAEIDEASVSAASNATLDAIASAKPRPGAR